MTKIILIRHAQSEGNVKGVFSGRDDPALSELGIRQAASTGRALVERGVKVARILSSPAIRAIETAREVVKSGGIETEIETIDELREMDYGDWEGREISSVAHPAELGRLFSDPSFAPPQGESVADLCQRTANVLEKESLHSTGGAILVVSHLGPVKAGIIWSLGCQEACFPRIRVDNASLSTLRVGPGGRYLVSANDTYHLMSD